MSLGYTLDFEGQQSARPGIVGPHVTLYLKPVACNCFLGLEKPLADTYHHVFP